MGGARGSGLFFAGDLGQRIFQQPFSWRSLGVDVRGRATTLKVNYRTSHQIRTQADRLLGEEVADVDGNVEVRRGTVSVVQGVPPVILRCSTSEDECDRVAAWLRGCLDAGVTPSAIGVIVRSPAEIPRAEAACRRAGLDATAMMESVVSAGARATITTMHLAKGLEFRAVAVMACDDGILPSRERLDAVGDDADLDEVYVTERQLLYVACTRARDFLAISGVVPVTEYIDDLGS
jgi:superfamily I DNA/RNA helicase